MRLATAGIALAAGAWLGWLCLVGGGIVAWDVLRGRIG